MEVSKQLQTFAPCFANKEIVVLFYSNLERSDKLEYLAVLHVFIFCRRSPKMRSEFKQ